MHTGTVIWFNPSKGFGFIKPSDNTKDVFLHISELEKVGIKNIAEGQRLSYRIDNAKGKDFATDIKLI